MKRSHRRAGSCPTPACSVQRAFWVPRALFAEGVGAQSQTLATPSQLDTAHARSRWVGHAVSLSPLTGCERPHWLCLVPPFISSAQLTDHRMPSIVQTRSMTDYRNVHGGRARRARARVVGHSFEAPHEHSTSHGKSAESRVQCRSPSPLLRIGPEPVSRSRGREGPPSGGQAKATIRVSRRGAGDDGALWAECAGNKL